MTKLMGYYTTTNETRFRYDVNLKPGSQHNTGPESRQYSAPRSPPRSS